MGFNADKFMQAKFVPRTRAVAIDAEGLGEWFDTVEGGAKWIVRGLTSNELTRANEAEQLGVNVDAIVKALASNADQVNAVKAALGYGNDTPGDVKKRLEILRLGSVDPVVDLPMAVRVAENFAIDFRILTNHIMALTGIGFDLAKPEAALQRTPDSSPQCDLPSSEAAISTNPDQTFSHTTD